MAILLHTIALEPARWTPQRVSQPLAALLPRLAESGFREIEIFEPHLREREEWPTLAAQMATLQIAPVVLSSYLDLNPIKFSDAAFASARETLVACLVAFPFPKVRLFAPPLDPAAHAGYAARLQALATHCRAIEFLLETHDGSLADDPEALAQFVEALALPNVGLLFQPTFFEPTRARAQFRRQLPLIRHVHLQNRVSATDLTFATLAEGIIPWPEILSALGPDIDLTLEFVPSGICAIEDFDLARALAEARREMDDAARISLTP